MFFLNKITEETVKSKRELSFLNLQLTQYLIHNQGMNEFDAAEKSMTIVSRLQHDKSQHTPENINVLNQRSIFTRMFRHSFMFQEMTNKHIFKAMEKMTDERKLAFTKQIKKNIVSNQKLIKSNYGFNINIDKSMNVCTDIIANNGTNSGYLVHAQKDFYPYINREMQNHSLNYYLESIIPDLEQSPLKMGLQVVSDTLKLNRETENFKIFKNIKNHIFKAIVSGKEDDLFSNDRFIKTIMTIAQIAVDNKLTTLQIDIKPEKIVAKQNKKRTLKLK